MQLHLVIAEDAVLSRSPMGAGGGERAAPPAARNKKQLELLQMCRKAMQVLQSTVWQVFSTADILTFSSRKSSDGSVSHDSDAKYQASEVAKWNSAIISVNYTCVFPTVTCLKVHYEKGSLLNLSFNHQVCNVRKQSRAGTTQLKLILCYE